MSETGTLQLRQTNGNSSTHHVIDNLNQGGSMFQIDEIITRLGGGVDGTSDEGCGGCSKCAVE